MINGNMFHWISFFFLLLLLLFQNEIVAPPAFFSTYWLFSADKCHNKQTQKHLIISHTSIQCIFLAYYVDISIDMVLKKKKDEEERHRQATRNEGEQG